jgi:hypothetical protein
MTQCCLCSNHTWLVIKGYDRRQASSSYTAINETESFTSIKGEKTDVQEACRVSRKRTDTSLASRQIIVVLRAPDSRVSENSSQFHSP